MRHIRPGPAHPRFEHASDVVALEQQRETGHVILVRVGQDHGIDPAIPRWDPPIERDQQAVRVRSTINQQPPASRTLDEDGIALADVEDRDAGDAPRASHHDAAVGDDEREHQPDGRRPASGQARVAAPAMARLARIRAGFLADRS